MREVNGRDHIPWIQQVPENWETAKLVRVTHISTGDMDTIDSTDDGPYPFYVRSPIVRKADRYTFDTVAVLMSGDGAGAGRIFHRASGPFACHQRVYCIEFSEKVTRDFGFYYLSTFFPMQVDAGSAKSTVDSIRKPMLNGMPIAFPSVFDQRIITGFLDYRLPEIDGLVEKLQREVQLLERYRRELIAHTVTRGLNPDAQMKDSGIDWMPQIPVHWIALRGKRVFRKLQRPVPPYAETVTCFRDGTVTLRKNRRSEGYTESLQEIGYQGIAPGDLVIHEMDAFAGAIGVSDSVGKSTPVYAVCALRNGGSAKFYAYLLRNMAQSNFILSLAKGIRQRTVDFRFKTLASLLIPVPPVKEQQQIAIFLDNKSSEIDATISNINKQIELLEKYRKQIINDAVTGKVRVGEMA